MTSFAAWPGAVRADDGTLLHVGNPLAEQRALNEGAVVPLPGRVVLALTGSDRRSWLDAISSQHLTDLTPGESAETLILSPQGRVEHQLRLVDDGSTLWAIVDADHADGLQSWLERMVFMRDVTIVRDGRWQVVGHVGTVPLTGNVVEWVDPWPGVVTGGHRAGTLLAEWGWRESLVPQDWEPDRVAGQLALDARRIAAGRPSLADVDDATIPHELDWLATAVHLAKGCYRGQETVAKVHNLGAPPRRLTLLHLDGSDGVLSAIGAAVAHDGREVGHLTAVGLHYELGPIALALLKRTLDPAAVLSVEAEGVTITAAQELIVPPDAGRNAPPPRIPRLGATTRPPRGTA